LERFERELLADGARGGGKRPGSRFLGVGTAGRMDVAGASKSPKLFSLFVTVWKGLESVRSTALGECVSSLGMHLVVLCSQLSV
jgi:hypothetical protein